MGEFHLCIISSLCLLTPLSHGANFLCLVSNFYACPSLQTHDGTVPPLAGIWLLSTTLSTLAVCGRAAFELVLGLPGQWFQMLLAQNNKSDSMWKDPDCQDSPSFLKSMGLPQNLQFQYFLITLLPKEGELGSNSQSHLHLVLTAPQITKNIKINQHATFLTSPSSFQLMQHFR